MDQGLAEATPQLPPAWGSRRRRALIITMNVAQMVKIGLSGHLFAPIFLFLRGFEQRESK